jgi:hypothetical protein
MLTCYGGTLSFGAPGHDGTTPDAVSLFWGAIYLTAAAGAPLADHLKRKSSW